MLRRIHASGLTRRVICGRAHWASAVIVLAGMLLVPSTVEACTCLEPGPACEAFWKSSAVFRGRVESIARQASKPPSRMPGSRRVTLTVLEAFTGVQTRTIDVTTG